MRFRQNARLVRGYIQKRGCWEEAYGPVQGPKQRVVLRHSFLKLAYCGPDKAITASDVKRALATKQVAKLDEAEDAILQAHALLSKEKVDGACKFFLDMLQQDVAAVDLDGDSQV